MHPTISAGEGGRELVGPLGECRSPTMQKQVQPEQERRQEAWEAQLRATGREAGQAPQPSEAQGYASRQRSLGTTHHANIRVGAAWPKQRPEPMLYLLGRRVGGARQEVTRLVCGGRGRGCRRETQRGEERERHRRGLSKQPKHTQAQDSCLKSQYLRLAFLSHCHTHPVCFPSLSYLVNKSFSLLEGPSMISQALRPFIPSWGLLKTPR